MKSLLIVLLMSTQCYALSGKDMLCHKNDYLSTDCMSSEVIPMSVYDKDVAIEEAKSEKNFTTNYVTNTKNVINQAPQVQEEVKVSTSLEYADDFVGYAKGYNSKEYKK